MLTAGHSNRALDELIQILESHGVKQLADVRKMPRSRHNPQFNSDSFAAALRGLGIEYRHMPGLGGLRRPRSDSINTAWRNESFRGYADYMQTAEFGRSLDELIRYSRNARTAILCAEAVPWRCHRSLIADALMAHGIAVEHIMSAARAEPHRITPFARVEGKRVTYPGLSET